MGEAEETWVRWRGSMFLSPAEKERRYAKVRQAMRATGIDCLVVCAIGGSWFHEGNVRYFVGDLFKNQSHDEYVLFPVEGEPTFVLTYAFRVPWARKSWISDVRAPADPRGKDPRFAGEKSRSVSLAEIIAEKGFGRSVIGIPRDVLPTATCEELTRGLPGAKFVDCAGLMLEVRRVKSAEEIDLARESAAIGDAANDWLRANIRAGALEHQLWAGWIHVMHERGCEKVYELVDTDPISVACVKWPQRPRILATGDTMVTEMSPCFGGYFTQLNRAFAIGQMHPKLRELSQVCQEAHATAAALLVPGNTAGQVARAMEDVVTRAGYVPLLRGGHTSTGLDLMEIPLHPKDQTVLEPGMVMILHPTAGVPGFQIGDPGFFGPGDTYVITATGAERLHKSSQDVVII